MEVSSNMATAKTIPVVICMGSSCFCRGNNRNIEVVQEMAERKDLAATIEPRGHLCENLCKRGPNIIIDGTMVHEADPVAVVAALNGALHKVKMQEGP
jgi:NADH:ubiquinone oxidoreductase subunit E